MLNFIFEFIGAGILTICIMFVWSLLLNKKINFKDYKVYLFSLILILLSIINYDNNLLIKFMLLTIIMSLIIKFVFMVTFKQSLITAVFSQIINVLAELIFSIFLVFIFKIEFNIDTTPKYIILLADLSVSFFSLELIRIKFIRKIYNLLYSVICKLSVKKLLMFALPIMFIFNAYLGSVYYEINTIYIILLNNVSVYIIVLIILLLVKKENDFSNMYDKYNTTLNSLKEYEDMLDRYRILTHENRNQLLTIRNMLPKSNKKIINYVDTLIENKLKDNERINLLVSVIPEGGLRGLIYSKLLIMEENKIDIGLNFSNNVKTVDIIKKISDIDMLDICQVIGVYLDNAIEATKKINKKHINIELYVEDSELVISICNNYKGSIDINKIEQKGYTTKTNGRGFGLSLAKQIINSNKKLSNEKGITKELFTQKLKIKM